MRLEHIAIWTDKLDALKDFCTRCFNGTANALYHNPAHGFSSYLISFPHAGSARLAQPRMTGGGCRESGALDPDGNRVEIGVRLEGE